MLNTVAEPSWLTLLLGLLLLLHHGLLLWGVAWVAWHPWRGSATNSRVGCRGHAWVGCCLRPRALHHGGVAAWLLLWCSTRVATLLVLLWGSSIGSRRALVGSLCC